MPREPDYEAELVVMAFDALRILMGGAPKQFSSADIAAFFAELSRKGIGNA